MGDIGNLLYHRVLSILSTKKKKSSLMLMCSPVVESVVMFVIVNVPLR